jgi:outer membrane receptor protein involved in Fe transport
MAAAPLPVTSTSFVYYFGGGLPSLSGVASPSKLYCHIAPPFQTDVKLSGSYPLPWGGVELSATIQSIPGPPIVATSVVPNAQIAPSLGRDLGAGPFGTATVQLVAPGTLYGDRLNQVDFRVMKSVKMRKARIRGSVDVYNLFNKSPVLALNEQYGPAWQRPLVVLPGRFAKLGLQVDF